MNFTPDPYLHDRASSASIFASKRDDAWFRDNLGKTWRVRPLLDGESPITTALLKVKEGARSYAVVIDHARAKDKRQEAGRVIYPVTMFHADQLTAAELRATLRSEALFLAKWFKRRSDAPVLQFGPR